MSPIRLLVGLAVFASRAFSTMAEDPLNPEEAAAHIGETATVCGVLASAKYEANAKSQPMLLDLGKPYPNSAFTAVVYGECVSASGRDPTHKPAQDAHSA